MTFNVAIVEDDETMKRQLTEYFERYTKETNVRFSISCFSDGDEICENFKCQFDVILLDIEMKRLNGLDTAKYVRRFDERVEIIFVTQSTQYAVGGYKVNALNYIVKPVTYRVFCAEVKRFTERVARKHNEYILISWRNEAVRLSLSDIVYIESIKHKIIFHTKDEEYEIFGTMKDFESRLEKSGFYRCNSGYLVNLTRIINVKDDMVDLGGTVLKISRPRKKQFMERLARFYCGE